jgi:hypothetical protein
MGRISAAFISTLAVGVGVSLAACEDDGGSCLLGEPIEHAVGIEFAGLPDGTHTCEVTMAAVTAGELGIALDCPGDGPEPIAVTIHAPAQAVPAGLEPGAMLELRILDGVEIGDPELEFVLSDAQGPIVAMSEYAYGVAQWDQIQLSFASDCPGNFDEAVWTGENNGFIRVEVDGQTVDLLPGRPQIVGAGDIVWEIHALQAMHFCCEGPTISAELIRR